MKFSIKSARQKKSVGEVAFFSLLGGKAMMTQLNIITSKIPVSSSCESARRLIRDLRPRVARTMVYGAPSASPVRRMRRALRLERWPPAQAMVWATAAPLAVERAAPFDWCRPGALRRRLPAAGSPGFKGEAPHAGRLQQKLWCEKVGSAVPGAVRLRVLGAAHGVAGPHRAAVPSEKTREQQPRPLVLDVVVVAGDQRLF